MNVLMHPFCQKHAELGVAKIQPTVFKSNIQTMSGFESKIVTNWQV